MTEYTDPPVEEMRGYRSKPGYVKLHPENNQHYLDQFRDEPWWPAISEAADALEKLVPGYNITQIKGKFGGLRFYVDKGKCPDEVWDGTADARHAILTVAENKVSLFERTGGFE
jgi:hypothetical protein